MYLQLYVDFYFHVFLNKAFHTDQNTKIKKNPNNTLAPYKTNIRSNQKLFTLL